MTPPKLRVNVAAAGENDATELSGGVIQDIQGRVASTYVGLSHFEC